MIILFFRHLVKICQGLTHQGKRFVAIIFNTNGLRARHDKQDAEGNLSILLGRVKKDKREFLFQFCNF